MKILHFQEVDRLPMIEWAGWWDKTMERWYKEGLDPKITDAAEIRIHLGLDDLRQYWLPATGPSFQNAKVENPEDYSRIKGDLYPANPFQPETIKTWAERQKRGETVVWITLEGFFWFPRNLFGIERHLFAFYDTPQLMHQINSDLLEFNIRALESFCKICVPDFMTFAEDMSYNHGPMISKGLFDEFIAPYYRRIVPEVKRCGIIPFIDSDGDIAQLIGWFEEVGVNGFLPLERQAGVDVAGLRRKHPGARFIGGYDKMVMSKSETEMRREFERLLPAMKTGGFIPSVDHQTPPEVSLANYKTYLKLLEEYCSKAMFN